MTVTLLTVLEATSARRAEQPKRIDSDETKRGEPPHSTAISGTLSFTLSHSLPPAHSVLHSFVFTVTHPQLPLVHKKTPFSRPHRLSQILHPLPHIQLPIPLEHPQLPLEPQRPQLVHNLLGSSSPSSASPSSAGGSALVRTVASPVDQVVQQPQGCGTEREAPRVLVERELR